MFSYPTALCVCSIASKISVTPAWFYVSSECPHPVDARSACTGRPSATTRASTGCGHSLLTYSQTGGTLILEALVHITCRLCLDVRTLISPSLWRRPDMLGAGADRRRGGPAGGAARAPTRPRLHTGPHRPHHTVEGNVPSPRETDRPVWKVMYPPRERPPVLW